MGSQLSSIEKKYGENGKHFLLDKYEEKYGSDNKKKDSLLNSAESYYRDDIQFLDQQKQQLRKEYEESVQ